MKKVIISFALTCLMLIAPFVFANEVVDAPSVVKSDETLFQELSTEAKWPDYKQALIEKDLILQDGRFPVAILSQIARNKAIEDNLSVGNLSEVVHFELFKTAYGLGNLISEQEFLLMARAGKFKQLVLQENALPEVAKEPVVEVSPYEQALKNMAARVEASELKAQESVDELNKFKAVLEKDYASIDYVDKSAGALREDTKKVSDQLTAYKQSNDQAVQDVVAKQSTLTENQTAIEETQTAMQKKQSSLERAQTNFAKTLKGIEAKIGNVPVVWIWVALGLAVAAVIGMLVNVFLSYFISKRAKEAKAAAEAASKKAGEALTTAQETKADLEVTKKEVKQQSDLMFHYDFDESLIDYKALSILGEGQCILVDMTHKETKNVLTVKVEKKSDSHFIVHGVKRNPTDICNQVVLNSNRVIKCLKNSDNRNCIVGWYEETVKAVA